MIVRIRVTWLALLRPSAPYPIRSESSAPTLTRDRRTSPTEPGLQRSVIAARAAQKECYASETLQQSTRRCIGDMDHPRRSQGRMYRVRSRSTLDPAVVAARREARRQHALRALLSGALPPGGVTHEWLANESGIPLEYLRWRYPTIEDILRMVDSPPP